MSVNVRLTIDPRVVVTISDAEYADLMRQGLIYSTEGGPPIIAPSFNSTEVTELARSFARRDVLYNAGAGLVRARARLGRAIAGTGLFHVLCAGDSTTAGLGADRATTSYPAHLKNALGKAGVPIAGSGLVTTSGNPKDARVTFAGAWSSPDNLLHSYTTTVGDTVTFAHTDPGTVLRIYYTRNSDAMTYSIDGGAPVTITPDKASGSVIFTEVTGLASTAHTVVVKNTGGVIQVFGSECRQTSGVSVSNFGSNGSNTAAWASQFPSAFMTVTGQAKADLLILNLGINDSIQSLGPATTLANLTSALNYFRTLSPDTDIALVAPNPIGSTATLPDYIASTYKAADAFGVPLVDLTALMGSQPVQTAAGTMSDVTHPNSGGYANIARAVSRLLS